MRQPAGQRRGTLNSHEKQFKCNNQMFRYIFLDI
jgi:hypothetical protein